MRSTKRNQRDIKTACLLGLLLTSLSYTPQAYSDHNESIRKNIRVGVYPAKPLNFIDENGVVQGFNPDLIREIFRGQKNRHLEFVPGTWSEGLERLQSEEIDLMVSVSYSPERAKIMDYAQSSTMEAWGQLFSLPDQQIENMSDLNGRSVGIMRKDINGENFEKLTKTLEVNCQLVEYATHIDVFSAVQTGKVAAGVTPSYFGLRHANDYDLVGSTIRFSPLPIYFAAKKGRHQELLDQIDSCLTRWKEDKNSYYYQQLNYWLGEQRSWTENVPRWLWIFFGLIAAMVLFLFGLNRLLHYQVKKRTAELTRSEEYNRTIFNSTNDAIFIHDAKTWAILDANTAAETLYKTSRENLLNTDIQCLSSGEPPYTQTAAIEYMKNAYAGHPQVFEWRSKASDGSLFWSEISLRANQVANKDCIIVVIRNIEKRKKAHQKLEESRRLLRNIIDTIPSRVWWKDTHSSFLGCNIHTAQDAGLDHPDQLIGKTDYDMCWKAEADHFTADDREVIKSGKPKLGIQEHQTQPDGKTRWIETNKIPLYDNDSHIIGTVGTYADITERKRMQEAIEKRIVALTRPLEDTSEIGFEDLFSIEEIQRIQDDFARATGVASIITLPDGTPVTKPSNFTHLCMNIIRKTKKGCSNCFKSDAALGICHPDGPMIQPCLSGGLWDAGASISVGGKHIANWLVGQVRDETQTEKSMLAYAKEIGADETEFIEAFRNVPAMSHEHFKQIADTRFTLTKHLSTSAYQNIQQARFITEQKNTEAKLRRLSTAIEQSPEAIMITDPEGVIEYVNPAFETTTGYKTEEAIGRNTGFLESGQHDEAFFAEMWETLRSGEVWKGQFINKRKDESLCTEESIISPVKNDAGMITHFVSVQRDITDELIREEQFQQGQKMEAVGQLAGGIAHDFNNMLQVILGFSEILQGQLGAESAEYSNVTEIRKAAKRAMELTRQLLAFSRKQPVEKTCIDINTTIRDTEVLIQLLLGKTTGCVFDLEPALHPIWANHGQLVQIIMNLSVNARDAMPDGGRLTFTTENITIEPQVASATPAAESGTFACLSITDTGEGMNQNVKDHLFEPFFTTKEVGKGTGLGLAVIYGIIKQNNGWINVYSEEGQGTTFKVYFPAEQDCMDATSQKKEGKKRVLLIDDDVDTRDMVAQILDAAGYETVSTEDAENALRIFERQKGKFDLIFSDIVLPGKNGIELANILRDETPNVPILLYSGYQSPRKRWNDLDRKGYLFLQKPFSMTELLAKVSDALTS